MGHGIGQASAHLCGGPPVHGGAVALIAWVALSVGMTVAAGQEARQPATGTGLIAGRVTDVTSNVPIAGAGVSLRSLNRITAEVDAGGRVTATPNPTVVTGSDGRFSFSGLPSGSYTVRTQLTGYTSLGSAYVELADDDRKTDVPLRLGRRGSVAGTVRDDIGRPVPGAMVGLFQKTTLAGTTPFLMMRGSARTDDQGQYSVGNLVIGDYFVCACSLDAPQSTTRSAVKQNTFAPTFYPGRTRASEAMLVAVDFSDDRTGIDISVTAVSSHRVSGRILGGGDADLAALSLSLLSASDLPEARIVAEFENTSGPTSGRFEFVGVPPGEYTVRANLRRAAGDEPPLWASQSVSVGDEDIDGLELTLRTGVSVSGRVDYFGQAMRPTVEELADAWVGLTPLDLTPEILGAIGATGRVGHRAALGSDGAFLFTDIIPGRYLMRGGTLPPKWPTIGSINAEGLLLPDTVVTVGVTDLSGVLVTVVDTPMAALAGAVTLRPYDVPQQIHACIFPVDRALWTEPFRAPGRFACGSVSASSTYSLATVPPGEYFLTLRHTWLADWTTPRMLEALARDATRLTLKAGETAAINLKR